MGREPLEALFLGGQVGAVAAALSRSPAVIDHRVGQEGVVADELFDPDIPLGDSRGVVGQDGVDLAPAAGVDAREHRFSLTSPVFIINGRVGTLLNYWNNYDQPLLNCFYSITSPTRSLQVIPVIQQRPQRCTRMIRTAGRRPISRANGSFPKGARRLSEKSPARTPHGTAGTASRGSAGVPPASCPFGRR